MVKYIEEKQARIKELEEKVADYEEIIDEGRYGNDYRYYVDNINASVNEIIELSIDIDELKSRLECR